MKRITVVTTNVIKSPEIFDSEEFIHDVCTFREAVFLTAGCSGVQVLKDALEPCKKFYFISHWSSIDELTPRLNGKYARRMAIFKKKYLSSFDVTLTYDFFPKVEAFDAEGKKAELNKKPLKALSNRHIEFSLEVT